MLFTQRNDGQRHLVVGSPVAHGGRPEVIWESPLAISRISARIRYRRGQRAVSKWGTKAHFLVGVLTSE